MIDSVNNFDALKATNESKMKSSKIQSMEMLTSIAFPKQAWQLQFLHLSEHWPRNVALNTHRLCHRQATLPLGTCSNYDTMVTLHCLHAYFWFDLSWGAACLKCGKLATTKDLCPRMRVTLTCGTIISHKTRGRECVCDPWLEKFGDHSCTHSNLTKLGTTKGRHITGSLLLLYMLWQWHIWMSSTLIVLFAAVGWNRNTKYKRSRFTRSLAGNIQTWLQTW